jgi:hypothetical protein
MPATDPYASLIDRIRRVVDAINTDLGLDGADQRVTFGYIGNCGPGFDDRSWSVFLPHSGRHGTDDDRIGRFRTGDLAGALAALNALIGFRRGIAWHASTS